MTTKNTWTAIQGHRKWDWLQLKLKIVWRICAVHIASAKRQYDRLHTYHRFMFDEMFSTVHRRSCIPFMDAQCMCVCVFVFFLNFLYATGFNKCFAYFCSFFIAFSLSLSLSHCVCVGLLFFSSTFVNILFAPSITVCYWE